MWQPGHGVSPGKRKKDIQIRAHPLLQRMAAGILFPSRWVWEVTEEQIDLLILGTTSPAQTINEKQTPKIEKNPSKSNQIKSAGESKRKKLVRFWLDWWWWRRKRIEDVPDLDKSESVGRNRGDARSDDRPKLMWLASGRGAERRGLVRARRRCTSEQTIKLNQNQTARKAKAKQAADLRARGLHPDQEEEMFG